MVRRLLRLAVRIGLFCVGALALYVAVTFVQVLDASNQAHQEPAQAIIVLGAAQYDGTPSPVLAARLDHAIELHRAGVANTIVVTGGKQEGDRFTEAAASFDYLRKAGIAEERILREEQGSNTWEQLAAATRELRTRGMTSAVLVSDDYHAYRLDRISAELGLDAQVSPVDPGLSVGGKVRAMGRETVAVAVGRVIGFRRLVNLDDQLSLSVGAVSVG
ncbi:YdcF family protein [Actinospongicola halichondriae]|uniref:YdcF family protein n=1 Tax=Actinospongicola halichondriae TaxID=3236844 RepID=UPI003D41B845